jgi:hypothetical protein
MIDLRISIGSDNSPATLTWLLGETTNVVYQEISLTGPIALGHDYSFSLFLAGGPFLPFFRWRSLTWYQSLCHGIVRRTPPVTDFRHWECRNLHWLVDRGRSVNRVLIERLEVDRAMRLRREVFRSWQVRSRREFIEGVTGLSLGAFMLNQLTP